MNTQQVLNFFRARFPFFDRDLLYYFVKQGYISFTHLRRPDRTLPMRIFSEEEVAKIEALLVKYQQKRDAESQLSDALQGIESGAVADKPVKPRVLIVEDEPLHLELMQDELQADFEVVAATTTAAAEAALESPMPFDAAVIDLALPEVRGGPFVLMSGLEVLKAARARGIGCLVVQSARISGRVEEELKKEGVLQVKKPAKPRKLAQILRDSLSGRVAPVKE
jgi:CheY-like chemotaxis protein